MKTLCCPGARVACVLVLMMAACSEKPATESSASPPAPTVGAAPAQPPTPVPAPTAPPPAPAAPTEPARPTEPSAPVHEGESTPRAAPASADHHAPPAAPTKPDTAVAAAPAPTSAAPTPGNTNASSTAPAPAVVQPAAAALPCGELSQPMCPLQGWMNHNLQKPLDAEDLTAVAHGLQRVPALVPDPSWNDDSTTGWSSLAQAATAAAQRGDIDATKQACKTCHRTWRKQYKDTFRLRPVPN